jgi:hypothetical protein
MRLQDININEVYRNKDAKMRMGSLAFRLKNI